MRTPRRDFHEHRVIAEKVQAAYENDLGSIGAFLPQQVPLDTLPARFMPYLSACAELPARYPAGRGGVRDWLDRQFGQPDPVAIATLDGLEQPERESLMTALSVLGHSYRWDTIPPAQERFAEQKIEFPAGLDRLWKKLAGLLGQPQVGTTWTMHLCNWRMADRPGGATYTPEELSLDNLRLAHGWLAPPVDRDLENFSLSFVIMEARGAAVLRALVRAIDASARHELAAALPAFADLKEAIKAMSASFIAIVRDSHIKPAVWLELIQPTFAWAVATEDEKLEGPSGMQLGTIQCLDAALGVPGDSLLAKECRHARRYLPPSHHHFIDTIDAARSIIPNFVSTADSDVLRAHINPCIKWLRTFRVAHSARAARYLQVGSEGHQARVSTGLGIHWRPQESEGLPGVTPQNTNDDPVITFKRTMAERIAETSEAAW